jgi:methyl-accepting chemotaxis protein
MFARLLWIFLLLSVSYILLVFAAPDFADTYGNSEINAKIRVIKEHSLNLGSTGWSPNSLWDELTGKASEFASGSKQFVDTTKQTVEQIQTTVTEKTEQVKKATESVQKAVDAVNSAKSDIEKVTTFSGTSRNATLSR